MQRPSILFNSWKGLDSFVLLFKQFVVQEKGRIPRYVATCRNKNAISTSTKQVQPENPNRQRGTPPPHRHRPRQSLQDSP